MCLSKKFGIIKKMYQKMISYMYEYVNGEKGNNIGFAKIASQNQRYKIKIQKLLYGSVVDLAGTIINHDGSGFGVLKIVS